MPERSGSPASFLGFLFDLVTYAPLPDGRALGLGGGFFFLFVRSWILLNDSIGRSRRRRIGSHKKSPKKRKRDLDRTSTESFEGSSSKPRRLQITEGHGEGVSKSSREMSFSLHKMNEKTVCSKGKGLCA